MCLLWLVEIFAKETFWKIFSIALRGLPVGPGGDVKMRGLETAAAIQYPFSDVSFLTHRDAGRSEEYRGDKWTAPGYRK